MRILVLPLLIMIVMPLAFTGTVNAQIMINDSIQEYSVANDLHYYTKGYNNYEQMLALRKNNKFIQNAHNTNNINLGLSYNPYLVYVPLHNNTDKEVELEICVPNPNISKITFYQINEADSMIKSYYTGKEYIFTSRPVLNRNFIFPFTLKAHAANTIFLSITIPHTYFYAPILLNKSGVFEKKDMSYFIFYIFFTSIMLFIIIIALVCGMIYESVLFVLYAIYILFSTLFFLSNEGLDFQFFYPDFPEIVATSNPKIYTTIAAIALLQFTILFFKSATRLPFANYLLIAYRIIVATLFITLCTMHLTDLEFRLFEQFYISFTDLFYLLLICTTWITIFTLVIYMCMNKMPNSGLFLLSISGLLITVTYTIMYTVGFIHKMYLPVNLMPITFTIEIIFLSVAFMYRTKIIEAHRKKLEVDLKTEQQQNATKQISIQDLERSRIANDLHDEIGSNLASLKIQLEQIDNHDEITNKKIATIMDVINSSTKSLHDITHNLMPPSFHSTAFSTILEKYFEKIKLNTKIHFEFYIHQYSNVFSKEHELIIYRIILELCHNILKHSQSNAASIQLIYAHHSLNIVAEDNGIGIDNQHSGFGLESMYSRVKYLAGTLETDSSKKGTLISIQIPYKNLP